MGIFVPVDADEQTVLSQPAADAAAVAAAAHGAVHINSVFSILNQLGVGPTEGFEIQDDLAQWDEFVSDEDYLEDVKSYVGLKVRLLFDPPTSSAAMEAANRLIEEFEWRLNLASDSTTTT